MKKIAIIGFGFCGRMAFVNLVKNYHKNFEVLIFDGAKKDNLKNAFYSAAFSDFSQHYILNVIAKKMSAFIDDEQHFCRFLQENYPQDWQNIQEFGFAPRRIYGEYIQKITDEYFSIAQKKGLHFSLHNAEILSLKKTTQNKFLLETINKNFYQVDEIILATSFKQTALPFEIAAKNVVNFLWNQDNLNFHNKSFSNETIALLGSGLTAVDVIVGLKKRNFSGKIIVISRRGNLPKKHFSFQDELPNFIDKEDAKKGILFLCLKIRKFLYQNRQFDLRHIIHSIKPITIDLWHNFDERNKRLFLRLMPYWTIFRHRAPQSSIEIIDEMIKNKQLEVVNGGLLSVEKKSEKLLLKTKKEILEVDYLVNCLGFEFRAQKYPLLKAMLNENLLKEDLLMVQSNDNRVHLLGGLNIGKDFECTSVPDMLVNIEKLSSSFEERV